MTWVEEAREMRSGGMTYHAIGLSVGKHSATVSRALNPERPHRNRQRDWYIKNRAEILAKRAGYYAEHTEEISAYKAVWREEKREDRKAKDREYYAAHKDERKSQMRAYAAENRERIRSYAARYRKEHPEVEIEHGAERRMRISGSSSPQEREAARKFIHKVKTAQRAICYLCGKRLSRGERTIDHIIPLAKGGRHVTNNLACACRSCNSKKKAKLPEEVGVLL